MNTPNPTQLRALQIALVILCALPAWLLLQGAHSNSLGANPIETITRSTGEWTLRFLLLTLAVTPLRKLTGLHWVLRMRRTLGLVSFAYVCAHFMTYLWLDQFFDLQGIAHDVLKRPFISVGFAAFVLMIPLAVTSTKAMVRTLGGRRWQNLHRSVYAIAIFGVLHYWWLVKADVSAPLLYSVILAVLLGLRAWWREQERRRQRSSGRPAMPAGRRIIPIQPE